ncbi:MAG: flagellar hook basal-body protein [Tepidisphaeraceae bacterium]
MTEGTLEQTDKPLDLALTGDGYLAVRDMKGRVQLTRSGNLQIKPDGSLTLGTMNAEPVLDEQQQPIRLDMTGATADQLHVSEDGSISKDGIQLAKVGVFTIADPRQLRPSGGTLLKVPGSVNLQLGTASVQSGYLERSNVDPAIELTRLMETQRQLEANANMIRYQDQSLASLVNNVGKIG